MQQAGRTGNSWCWRNDGRRAIIRVHVSRPGGALSKYLLRLFVTGASSRTGTAIANLRRICEQELGGQYDLEIIDVLEFPELAEDEKILATPTLIKTLRRPRRRRTIRSRSVWKSIHSAAAMPAM